MLGVKKIIWVCLVFGLMIGNVIAVDERPDRDPPPTISSTAYNEHGYPLWDAFDASGIAIGVEGGTLGPGGVIAFRVHDWLNLRVKVNAIGLSYSETLGGFNLSYDYSGQSGLFIADFYPGNRRAFRFSTGIVYQNRYIDVSVTPRVPRRPDSDEAIDSIDLRADYGHFVPYFGIGAGNSVRADHRLSVFFDLGVVMQSYDFDVPPEYEDIIPGTTIREIEKRLDLLNIYPVVSLGIIYHF